MHDMPPHSQIARCQAALRRASWTGWWFALVLLCTVLLPGVARAGGEGQTCALPAPSPADAFFVPAQALLRDPTGQLTVDDVAAPGRAAEFVPFTGQFSGGYTEDALWLRFCLPPDAAADAGVQSRPRWLRIAPPMLDDLALYLPRDGGYALQTVGDRHPFTDRAWDYRLFAMPVASDTEVSRPVYLRVVTSSALNMRVDLWPEAEFQHLVVLESAFYGVLAGAVVLLAVFSLIAWVWLRDTMSLFYGVNVVVGGFFLLMNAGFGSQFLYRHSSEMNDHFIAWFTGPILAIHIWFFTYLFAVRRHLPKVYPFMLSLAGVYALLTPLSFFTDWRNIGILLQIMAFPVTLIWMVLVSYLGWKDRGRRVYLYAFLPWLIGLFASSAVRLGLVSDYFFISYSGEFTALIHLFVLPVLIIHRTRQAELAKDQALARELSEARRMERELEHRVDQRTEELQEEIQSRERLQVQLKDALSIERATLANQRQFVAMLSHELRTPLSIIDTTAQRLDMRLEGTRPDLVPKIGKIRRAVQRLTHLVENCLAAERLDGAGLELHLEDLDLRCYLANLFAERMLVDSARVLLELPSESVTVRCDRHLFEVALWNLVENALKYSPADRPITLRLLAEAGDGAPPGQIALVVRDQGAGVRPEDRERIFERFFRSEGLARIPGAGLGLHLARVLARRHGGDLILVPSEPGEGAIFVLTLPKVSVRKALS